MSPFGTKIGRGLHYLSCLVILSCLVVALSWLVLARLLLSCVVFCRLLFCLVSCFVL